MRNLITLVLNLSLIACSHNSEESNSLSNFPHQYWHDWWIHSRIDFVSTSGDLVEAGSVEELSKMVGFEVNNLTVLPFDVTETTYMSYWGELAEITYLGDGQTATYRISLGDEDISGDYSDHPSVIKVNVNETTVTLKGNDEKYNLAVWNDDKYSYSIQFTQAISRDDWLPILKQLD